MENGNLAIASQWAPPNRLKPEKDPVKSQVKIQINRVPNADIFVPEIKGVLIVGVFPDSPAMVAGLLRGDVITAIDDTTIASSAQLQSLIDRSQIGQPMEITLRRREQTQQWTVIPRDIPELLRFGN